MSVSPFPSQWPGTPYAQLRILADWGTFEDGAIGPAAWNVIDALNADNGDIGSWECETAGSGWIDDVLFAASCADWAYQVKSAASTLSAAITATLPQYGEAAAAVVEGVGAQGTRPAENLNQAIDDTVDDLKTSAGGGLAVAAMILAVIVLVKG